MPDPWEVARKLSSLPHLIFFDSAGGPRQLTRYSYVAADPVSRLTSQGEIVEWNGSREAESPFQVLARELVARRRSALSGLPPFQGGAAGLFGYDLCHWLERLPRPRFNEFAVPDMAIGFYDWVVAWDHEQRRSWLIGPMERLSAIESRLRQEYIEATRVERTTSVTPALNYRFSERSNVFSTFTRAGFEAAAARAIEYINAGDCFQVNLSQRLLAPANEPALALYGRLRRINPAPFAGYFDLGGCQILSASPERFLHVSPDGAVETCPIKGTRPRGNTLSEDEALRQELAQSAKDRAENVMIVDLLRNDLGRVCAYGSVRAPVVCRLESYATVHHLVSEVHGQLRPGATAVDLLQAAFPGGSVTGAPKIRAMEIIAELEPTARGPYCGCLGWLGWDGAMDTNILIRTFTRGGGWLQFPVGGGIVADSNPAREYQETLDKARGLLRAIDSGGASDDQARTN